MHRNLSNRRAKEAELNPMRIKSESSNEFVHLQAPIPGHAGATGEQLCFEQPVTHADSRYSGSTSRLSNGVHADAEVTHLREDTKPAQADMERGSWNRSQDHNARRRSADEALKLKADIKTMELRIANLERSEARLKGQIRQKVENLKDMKVEVDRARAEALRAEEARDDMEVGIQDLQQRFERYKRWWLTDYYSMKVILELVPNKDDVRDIALGAQARFKAHCKEVPQ
ncbi:hypothetical protein NMY22_g19742 [Coprinellus aureogranulatus]|nr:hypothetical protein NMY22_g19742 [Coprinellus aureogranulatus]